LPGGGCHFQADPAGPDDDDPAAAPGERLLQRFGLPHRSQVVDAGQLRCRAAITASGRSRGEQQFVIAEHITVIECEPPVGRGQCGRIMPLD